MPTNPARTRPLVARPGARFACFGDGLCCTDIHALGPVTKAEKNALPLLPDDALVMHEGIGALVLRTVAGHCAQLGPDGCRLHAQGGALAKPASCRRFPFGLTATPLGGRITTEHRCPCRSLGERPPLDPKEAEASLRGSGGKLKADRRVGERLRLEGRRTTTYARYLALEAALLEALAAASDPLEALETEAFPELDGMHYADVAHHLRAGIDGTKTSTALAFAGDVILGYVEERRLPLRDRPWRVPFDRAEARSKPAKKESVLADFLADEVFALRWSETTSFRGMKQDLATRGLIASIVCSRLERTGVRPDRAMAEGVMIAELLGLSGPWSMVLAAFDRR